MAEDTTQKLLVLIINLIYLRQLNSKLDNSKEQINLNNQILDRLLYTMYNGDEKSNLRISEEDKVDFHALVDEYKRGKDKKKFIRQIIRFIYNPIGNKEDEICDFKREMVDIERDLFSITYGLYMSSKIPQNNLFHMVKNGFIMVNKGFSMLAKNFHIDTKELNMDKKENDEIVEAKANVFGNLFQFPNKKRQSDKNIGSDVENYYLMFLQAIEI